MIGKLRILTGHGHTTVKWSTDLQETVDAANARFDALLEDGYTAFRIHDTSSGDPMGGFDATAESIIMVPRMVGG